MTLTKNTVAVAVVALCLSASVSAQDRNSIEDIIQYEIGGKSRIPNRDNTNLPIEFGLEWETPSCSSFNPSLSVRNFINGVTGALEDIESTIVSTATGVVSSLPMMELARADPELYEMIKRGQLKAEELFQMSVASCQEITQDRISKSGKGLGDWVKYSGFEEWSQSSSNSSGKDVVQEKERIEEEAGNRGVEMPSGQVGGEDMPPINVLWEGVLAGSNALTGRQEDDTSEFSGDSEIWVTQYWSSPEEMKEWAKDVVGEVEIRTCTDCGNKVSTTVGRGVYPKLRDEQKKVIMKLETLIEGVGPESDIYDPKNLEEVSAPGFPMRPQVIESLKSEDLYRGAFVEAVAEEVALRRLSERLLALRRVIIAGKRNALIAKNEDSLAQLEEQEELVMNELKVLQDEFEFRQSVKSSVVRNILERSRKERNRKVSQPKREEDIPTLGLEELTQ